MKYLNLINGVIHMTVIVEGRNSNFFIYATRH